MSDHDDFMFASPKSHPYDFMFASPKSHPPDTNPSVPSNPVSSSAPDTSTKVTRPKGPEPDQPITLQIGESTFKTTISTLTSGSTYFASLFSGRWTTVTAPGEPYFIDADPDAFTHVLRYLRSDKMPLFWTQSTGFDLGVYASVLTSAEYFGVDALAKWIEDKKFFEAVRFRYAIKCDETDPSSSHQTSETKNGDTALKYEAQWGVVKVYICPRGIAVHRGAKEKCGRQCASAQEGRDVEYEEERAVVGMNVIAKKVILDLDVLEDDSESE